MTHEPQENLPHPDFPQSWDLLHGDAKDLVYALVGAFGGEYRILEDNFIAWVPPRIPPVELTAFVRNAIHATGRTTRF
jgi:hypothetical protein